MRTEYDHVHAVPSIAQAVAERMRDRPAGTEPVILCIGTDRSTGDALGPLVGSLLLAKNVSCRVLGTLDVPVHAVNLAESIDALQSNPLPPFIVAVDACLGQLSSVGQVSVGDGCLQPGAGVHKKLPAVGDMHVTGIVNVGGFMEYFVLQNTRLSIVFRMAHIIADGIADGLQQSEQVEEMPGNVKEPFRIPGGRFGSLFRTR